MHFKIRHYLKACMSHIKQIFNIRHFFADTTLFNYRCCSDIREIRKEQEFVKAAKRILDGRKSRVPIHNSDDKKPQLTNESKQPDNNNNLNSNNNDIYKKLTTRGIRYTHR